MKNIKKIVLILVISIVVWSGALYADSVQNLATNIDKAYMTLMQSAPKKTKILRVQKRYWSNLEKKLLKSIATSTGDILLSYQVLHEKVSQKDRSFRFSTTDLIVQFQVINETNRIRKENGRNLLTYNYLLSLAAYHHATDMYTNFPNRDGEILSHTSSNGNTLKERVENVGYGWLFLAENIAWNQETTDQVMKEWMNSEGHKKNILSDSITEIGVAKVGPYRVQDFGQQMINK